MPAIVACAACQTKLKVPENSAAKALRCPKCKAVVPLAPPQPPPKEEEFEVNEEANEQEEEFEVNEAAGEEADDDEPQSAFDKNSPLAKLGFVNVKNPYKKASVPDDAKKAIEKLFIKNEKTLWAGRPSRQIIESKAWIGFVVGLCLSDRLRRCIGLSLPPIDQLAPACSNRRRRRVRVDVQRRRRARRRLRKRIGGNVTPATCSPTTRLHLRRQAVSPSRRSSSMT